ncbi:MAG: hypothetical protein D6794_01610 [Deltaproteobacteria bacterium]|nr:MAG: hypothetical protein D6794_01610 [Deltaproteobacteria bacterium]
MIATAVGHPVYKTAALFWTLALIFLASDSASGGPDLFAGQDKVLHAGAFALLCALYGLGWPKGDKRPRFWLPALWAFCFGALIEIGQLMWTQTRSAEWLDLAADLAGIVLAGIFLGFVGKTGE